MSRRRPQAIVPALLALLGLLGLLGFLVSGCGQDHVHAPTAAPVPGPADGQAEARLRVGLTEWSVVTQASVVPPGPVTLLVTNSGATAHDLAVHGAKGAWHTPELRPGQQATLRIDAAAGEQLHLECGIAGHDLQGMHAVLDVADRPG